jgi:hypothetical protein
MSEHIGEADAVHDKLPPADFYDPVIEAYKKDVDRTLLRENLKLTVEQRLQKFASFSKYAQELRGAAWRSAVKESNHGR